MQVEQMNKEELEAYKKKIQHILDMGRLMDIKNMMMGEGIFKPFNRAEGIHEYVNYPEDAEDVDEILYQLDLAETVEAMHPHFRGEE